MLRLKSNQYISLSIAILSGMIWIFLAQEWLFLNILSGFFQGDGLNLDEYLQSGTRPSFAILWLCCIAALLSWLVVLSRSQPRNADEVLRFKPLWWAMAAGLAGLGWALQFFFTVLRWQFSGDSPIGERSVNYYPVPPAGWMVLFVFVILDVAILFWIPSLISSPRNYRLVVPGATKFLGGR